MSKNTELELAGPLEAVFKNPETVRENIKLFRAALPKILDPKVDIAIIHGKPFTRKSGWDAINRYFGVDTEPISSWRNELPDGEYSLTVAVKASKGGTGAARSGTCSSIEMKAKHDGKDFAAMESACHGMAETRAVGRASASFYMVADVSAEEVEGSPGPMKKEGGASPTSQTSPGQQGITICICPTDKIKLTDDGKYCIRCNRLLDETKRKLVWKEQKFQPKS